MAKPWREAGFKEIRVDLEHSSEQEDNVCKLTTDVRSWDTDGENQKYLIEAREHIKMVFAFPPCTHLAVSGARWFKKKGLRALSEAIDIFGSCVNIIEDLGVPGFCENPVSTISTYYRKPDYSFDPCDYGDPYTKKTCLWTYNGFVMPPKNRIEPVEGSKMHLMAPSEDRARLRSVTPEGFAKAVFEANKHLICKG
jgi:hypothetical protein